ncbi:type II toxin-antitoxin system RelE/ParE family toxin [Achromobacter xylosoxidans]|uniref:type II toxin-antitoxin system RelE/ParE family toxin n=1 Tax=Alcaligenes xylosoxydans xylosoxydans TaxID=85698 RepID=UPI000B48F8C8|nr:type II toxin-antitoxin system RelE/ParE family toxin [Achromobacter xylosoxidans]
MAAKLAVKLTAHFERQLEEIDAFLTEAGVPRAFDALLDELVEVIIPNLAAFPDMGRLFLERSARSVEVANGVTRLAKQLRALAKDAELREYVSAHYLMLYARIKDQVYLLSIRHHRQLSFDFPDRWRG